MAKQPNQPNAIVSGLFADYLLARKDAKLSSLPMSEISGALKLTCESYGAISMLSKNNLLRLMLMQTDLGFMPKQNFMMATMIACDELKIIKP